MLIPIADAGDERLGDYLRLNDTAFRRRFEADAGCFIVEGTLAIERLLELPRWRVRSLFVTSGAAERLRGGVAVVDAPVYVAEQEVIDAVVGFPLHRGAVASVARPEPAALADVVAPPARLVAGLEGVNDHENLGALFRNAAAFGVDAVVLDTGTADPIYRRSVRVSVGHVLAVPFARCADLGTLSALGFTTVALTPSAAAEPLDSFAAHPPERVALLLGAEGPGLSAATLDAAHRLVRIPMAAGVDSLNVATAAAIAFSRLSSPAPFRPSPLSSAAR